MITIKEVLARRSSVLGGQVMTPNRETSHYQRGTDCAAGMERISIAKNNTWSGRAKNGGHVTSYETIGYHVGSADWLAGAVDSDCEVYAWFDGWERVVR